MKKLFILFSALLICCSLLARVPGNIDEKVVQQFNSSFPKAEQVTWYELPASYAVNFTQNGIRSRIVYRKDGQSLQFTRYYLAPNLPMAILSKIKRAYPNKNIFGVTEITSMSGESEHATVSFFIRLEDDKRWYTVEADVEGNLVLVDKFRKA